MTCSLIVTLVVNEIHVTILFSFSAKEIVPGVYLGPYSAAMNSKVSTKKLQSQKYNTLKHTV